MSDPLALIEQRLARAERQTRQLRLFSLAAVCLAVAGFFSPIRPAVSNPQITATNIQKRLKALERKVEDLKDDLRDERIARISETSQLTTGLAEERVARQAADVALQTQDTALQGQITPIQTLLQPFSRTGSNLFLTGVNLNIVNGTGDTLAPNGTGNLILGYNEARPDVEGPNVRTGSHSLVIGTGLNYSGAAHLVAGQYNTASGSYSSVLAGLRNTASGDRAAVYGGLLNVAVGADSVVLGGRENETQGQMSTVTGGCTNFAFGTYSSVSGGFQRGANGQFDWVAGTLFEDQ